MCVIVYMSVDLQAWKYVRYFCICMFIPINTVLLVWLSPSLSFALSLSLSPLLPSYTSCSTSFLSFLWVQETPEGEIRVQLIWVDKRSPHFLWRYITSLEEAFSLVVSPLSCHQLDLWTGLQHHGQRLGQAGRCRFFTDLATFRRRW